ncbi:PREDICTED: keratin, type I cytoskeletal 9-like [Branchiostoma belcheri]|uniref:Keratin, type I cytoskeletal 9-like n=1 Tax=Branchiostoma belcheri TaxID=7741 RepID=A0A6P4ZD14_BRABE|nr:PREDICTED: keratin, type I cytoskeletal 9-like [Branchiostoma belcheri]
MAESKLLNRLSEDFLECQICLQPYRRPKVLSCLHFFCQQCLEEFLKKQKVKTELDCPTCRNKTVLPDGGVAELKDNFFVESLRDTVDVHKKLANEGESLVCGSCEAKSGAESFCTECGDFLCDECVAIHRRIKVTKGHQVIGVEQLRSAESEAVNIKPRPLPPCRHHSQETLKLFCVDCSEAICQLCTVLSHKDHKYEYFADTAGKAKGEIGALLAKAEKKVTDLKNAGQQAHAQKTQLEKNVTETVENIKRKAEETRRQLVAMVNKQEADLLNSVNTVSQTRSKEFSTAIDEIETATVALESAAEFGRNIVEHGSEFEIMAVSGEVNSRLKKLLGLEIADMTEDLPAKAYIAFEEDKTSAMAKPHLGDVKTSKEDSGFRTARLTTLGTTGRLGPTSLGTHYGGQDHEGLVQLKDGIQYFTVPDSGQYRIEAAGSAAGWGRLDKKSARGRGAVVRGTFQLKKGEVLKILVGQEGLENKSNSGVGGGGGTFVTKRDNTPLLVAGGAGGGDYTKDNRNPNSDGTTAAAGQSSSGGKDNFTGGSDGKGATHGDDDHVGGGGGGLLTDGASGKTHFGGTDGGYGGEGGKAFVNGGVGGRGVNNNAEGGFGGGGGSYGASCGGGGGGGYSGGGRGDDEWGACAGGGGSYNAGSDASGEGGANDGPGYVTLTRTV